MEEKIEKMEEEIYSLECEFKLLKCKVDELFQYISHVDSFKYKVTELYQQFGDLRHIHEIKSIEHDDLLRDFNTLKKLIEEVATSLFLQLNPNYQSQPVWGK